MTPSSSSSCPSRTRERAAHESHEPRSPFPKSQATKTSHNQPKPSRGSCSRHSRSFLSRADIQPRRRSVSAPRIVAVRSRLPTHVHIALSCAGATTHGGPLASSSAIRKIARCRTVRVHGVERGMNSFRHRKQPGAFLERSHTRSRNHQGPSSGCGSDGNLDGSEHFERTACSVCLNGLVPSDASQDTSLPAAILAPARHWIGSVCRQRISAPVRHRVFVRSWISVTARILLTRCPRASSYKGKSGMAQRYQTRLTYIKQFLTQNYVPDMVFRTR